MSLYAILQGQEMPVIEFSFNEQQSKITEFEFTVPAHYISGSPKDLLFESVAAYRDGVQIVSGIVASYPQPVMADGQAGFYRISCDGEVGRLYLEMPMDIQFQNIPISTCISTLLGSALGSVWLVNNVSTLVNDEITIDVRDRESLWAQIESILEQAGTASYWRYAGRSGGFFLLDLGSFGEQDDNYKAIQGDNIISPIRYKQSTRQPIKEIRPISGKVGNKPVALSEALVLLPALATDPEYPLIAASNTVRNDTITNGRRLRKRFTEHKTRNALPPTNAERQQTAVSLYRKARREIISSAASEALDFTCLLPFLPNINARLFVRGDAVESVLDVYTEQITQRKTISIEDWYRIVGIKTKLVEQHWLIDPVTEQLTALYQLDLNLTSGDDADIYDEETLIIDKLATNDLEDNAGTVLSITESVSVPINQNAVAANCTWTGVNTGRLFTFPMPTVPPYATNVITSVAAVTPANITWNVFTAAALPATSLQLCVSGPGPAPWSPAANVTITVVYSFA